jgi:REP element-mobilizing transposase RayT
MPAHTAHQRRSIRLRNYDYAANGAYFVTICAFQRECLFGEVVDGEMRMNDFGVIVRKEWERSTPIRAELSIDAYVVMPNHFHGIVHIDVGAHGVRPGEMAEHFGWAHGRAFLRSPKSLGSFIAGFKSAVTKHINQSRGTAGVPVWQRNYYERVIRDDRELDALREYIVANPARWADDDNHPAREAD